MLLCYIQLKSTEIASSDTQEAQLSQRDRATLLVMEYFAKSLNVTQGHSKRHC